MEYSFPPDFLPRVHPLSAFLQQSGIVAAIGFRLLLILSLWQGPIVWGHYHDGHHVQNGHGQNGHGQNGHGQNGHGQDRRGLKRSGLAEHLARYHQGETKTECGHWHWHVTLAHRGPVGEHDSLPPGHPVIPQDLVSPVLVAPTAPMNAGAAIEISCLTPVEPRSIGLNWDLSQASGFLATYFPTHSPQDVLCRRLC